jgi:hypothetical protein
MSQAQDLATLSQLFSARAVPFRNRIINGDHRVNQRGGGATVVDSYSYVVDRWYVAANGAAVTANNNGGAVGAAAQSLVANGAAGNTNVSIGQRIESRNIQDLAGQKVTLSGYLYATQALQPVLTLNTPTAQDNFASMNVVAGPALPLIVPNAWNYFRVTATLAASASNGLQVDFSSGGAVGAGVSYAIGAIQLEAGENLNPGFEIIPFSESLARCQRYFFSSYPVGSFVGANDIVNAMRGIAMDANNIVMFNRLPVPMRVAPSVSIFNPSNGTANQARNSASGAAAGITGVNPSALAGAYSLTSSGGFTAGNPYDFHIYASAEL